MKPFLYETHLHTSEGSACGTSSGSEYIKPFYDAGYSGFFVTDHFFGGNTASPRDADWQNRINIYCSGYEKALKAAELFNKENNLENTEREFKVFFGIEQTFNGDDYLIYGLNKQWLLEHPEIETMRHAELFYTVNQFGGLLIQAHPFRMRNYINAIHLHPRDVHGVEIYNAANKQSENVMARIYADEYNFPVTSGSDIHNIAYISESKKEGKLPLGGMAFEKPLNSVFDYVNNVKERKYTLLGLTQ